MNISNNFIDVHTFDGKVEKYQHKTIDISSEKQNEMINYLFKLLVIHEKLPYYEAGLQGIKMIISTGDKGNENMDNIHGHHALYMLLDVISYLMECKDEISKYDILKLLLEQMSDCYTTGRCNIGRCSRLRMILMCFI